MAEISTIARPYADALFQVAQQSNLDEWARLIGDMAAVAANADMRALMSNPKFSTDQIYGVFVGAVGWKMNVEAQNFVRTLIENGRLALMPEIAAQFDQLKNASEGTADAKIISAFEMTEAQVSDLIAVLEKRFNSKLKPTVTVDESLIGGVRIVVGDQVLDTSVRSRLDQMRAALVA
jgi:F-type H+-transporting ATPase subunit delta